MPKYLLIAAAALLATPAYSFEIEFAWNDIPLCTTGKPNRVANPAFRISGLPEGTTSIQFKMVDLDVPSYNHGGSKKIKLSQDGVVPEGTFNYKSPCPPNGAHTYEWRATARAGSKKIGVAKASRQYPE